MNKEDRKLNQAMEAASNSAQESENKQNTPIGEKLAWLPTWLQTPLIFLLRIIAFIRFAWRQFARFIARMMPKGLYGRSLIIIVAPMVILQSVLAFVFMERHWQTVTNRLSEAVTRDIAAIIAVIEQYPQDADHETIIKIAKDQMDLNVALLPAGPLPPPGPKPFFSLLDRALSQKITAQIGKPFWIDTVGRSNLVEVRIKLQDSVLRVFTRRSQTYASNSHIFLIWMIGTSLVLLIVAILFLRNQIRPIQRLANAAEQFGKGQDLANFRPTGAREVRQAAHAFIEMKRRIERQIEQRTTMLAGVSHDLRTVLTRFKLQLALFEDEPEARDMQRDVDEMQHMLEDYLAFARGVSAEKSATISIPDFLEELSHDAERSGKNLEVTHHGRTKVSVRPQTMKRCLTNLVSNALRYGNAVELVSEQTINWWTITIDDDGPGIPPEEWETVFKPFYRLDTARNQDISSTGLGLAIARDIARGHGGDIKLCESPAGGLRATIRLPV